MIEYKTAVLLGAAMKMGAIVAGTSEANGDAIYDFGMNLGVAFQLQDDYLDAFGNPETFGKQVGGDIIENKKTYLYLKAMEFASDEERSALKHIFSTDSAAKVEQAKAIFNKTGAADATKSAIREYTETAFKTLDKLDIPENRKKMLRLFGNNLMDRTT